MQEATKERSSNNHNNLEITMEESFSKILTEHITTVIHVFVLAFFTLITYLCFSHEVVLMTWHPFFMTTAWILTLSEGIMSLRRDNVFTKHSRHTSRVACHWILQLLALCFAIVGFSVVVANKIRYNSSHFTTLHGKIGLAAFVCVCVTALGGVVTLIGGRFVKPNLSKLGHGLMGVATYLLGAVAIFVEVFREFWFWGRISSNEFLRVFSFVVVLVGVLWVVAKPVQNSLRRIKAL